MEAEAEEVELEEQPPAKRQKSCRGRWQHALALYSIPLTWAAWRQ